MTHYIAMSGMHGCLPDYCTSHDTETDACEDLTDIHELNADDTQDLHANHYVDLDRSTGAEYAEITECDCDNPTMHNDS